MTRAKDISKIVSDANFAGTLDVAGETTLATHLNMGDGDIIKLGASADLQIQHNGSGSYVSDSGTGFLFLQGAAQIRLQNPSGANYAIFADGGASTLYHNNSAKFATTSTGIDVTGIIVSDGMSTNTSGTSNFIAGVNAGNSITSGGNYNTVVGDEAGTAITTGTLNTLVGSSVGDAINTGAENVALGYNALSADVKGNASIAIGSKALQVQSFSGATDVYNTAVGHNAGKAVTTGIRNTLIGSLAGDALTDADYNIALGYQTLSLDTKGSGTVAIGYKALSTQNLTSSTTTYNTAVGYLAGQLLTTGINNTIIGAVAGDALSDADFNVAVGVGALGADTKGNKNTAIGHDALGVQNFTSSTDAQNTAVGYNAGAAMTTGSKNTILGSYNGNQGGLDIRTASNNIVLSDGDGNPHMFYRASEGTGGAFYFSDLSNSTYWPKVGQQVGQNAVSIDMADGQLGITSDAHPALFINKNNADGSLILFYAQGNNEGNISVSGTTVSYNGGHLSRWSQLSDGSKNTTIVKGTVMTNLDQMAVWKHEAIKIGDDEYNATGKVMGKATEAKDAYTEDNEQLNCMAISSVEGDVNVSGVFVNWDNLDDGFNDMNIAMTGDMVIKIAKGTTVARGELLMSAGDGTAKPQGDDIVRSKTIAKVTSTNVSHTYDDGTYLVPCVLMAC